MTGSFDVLDSHQGLVRRFETGCDFYRLATGLRAMIIDFDYAKTRQLLDPKWDGYIVNDMEVVADDVNINDANLLTSRHRDSELHRVVLDLDYGASLVEWGLGGHRLTLTALRCSSPCSTMHYHDSLVLGNTLRDCGMTATHLPHHVHLHTHRDLVLIPSSTPGHHHLILDVNLEWSKYVKLLQALAATHFIEPGYANASIRKGYSAIRVPWVKK